MADEQTPQSDLIDDAIRQAERQLEEKLEALRMSALGEIPAPSTSSSEDAVLRPTDSGAKPKSTPKPKRRSRDAWDEPVSEQDEQPVEDTKPATSWRETSGSDVSFAPVDGEASVADDKLYVPDAPAMDDDGEEREPSSARDLGLDEDEDVTPEDRVHAALSSDVTDLTPVWGDADEAPVRPTTSSKERSEPKPRDASFERQSGDSDWERPEPVHATWTGGAEEESTPRPTTAATPQPATPTEDEMRFWAHTRTALRNLQQVSEQLPNEVSRTVLGDIARVVHDEVAPAGAAIRDVKQQLSQGMPRMQERIESVIEQSLAGPSNGIRQIRDDLPAQLDRSARELRGAIREELDVTANAVHAAVQNDVAQLEQSIATNVTRMAQGTGDSVARVERDIDTLGETLGRFEHGMHTEFDRVEAQLRGSIERAEQNLRDELLEPTQTVRKLSEDLPTNLGRVERSMLEQQQHMQRDLSAVLSSLVDASRATLDRVNDVTRSLNDDRAQRTTDIELVVDTVTTGWEGLAAAVKALFEQNEETSRRIGSIENRLSELRDLEKAVDRTMGDFRSQMGKLEPAPIMVTVSHPDAEVQNTSRSGWLPAQGDAKSDSRKD